MVTISKATVKRTKKRVVIIGGILLLLAPFGMFFGFFAATAQYFVIYPVAIGLFIYLTKQL